MVARIAGAADGPSPADWFNSLPPVSRSFGAACVLTTLLFSLGMVNPMTIFLSWELIVSKFHIWRLLTNFVFIGKFSFNFFIYVMMIARYTCVLEKTTFQNRTDDFVFMNLFGMVAMLALTALVPMAYSPFLSGSLIFMHCYLWSRFNHTTQVRRSCSHSIAARRLHLTCAASDGPRGIDRGTWNYSRRGFPFSAPVL